MSEYARSNLFPIPAKIARERSRCEHKPDDCDEFSRTVVTSTGDLLMTGRVCGMCGQWMSVGDSDESPPAVAVAIRAAMLAADFKDGVGIGGHRPNHCTGEHCWHWFEDDHSADANVCCYCGHDGVVLPGIENECLVGQLARELADAL